LPEGLVGNEERMVSLETMQGSGGYTASEVIGGRQCTCPPGPTGCDICLPRWYELTRQPKPSITDEARRLVAGERAEAYGPAEESFGRVGRMWGALLGVPDIEPRRVALMLTALKLSREAYRPGKDNRTDAVGYLLLADRLSTEGD